jgi:hypothetical protein
MSFAFLINGIAGVYPGAFLSKILWPSSPGRASAAAMLIACAGIMLLISPSLPLMLISAAVMGLFDGFGTPRITACYLNEPGLQRYGSASMLAVWSGVSGAVQIACPPLYNFVARLGGGGLLTLGIFFLVAGTLILQRRYSGDTVK